MSLPPLRRVFVYGTLKRGEPNHHWLTSVANGEASFVGRGTTVARYPLVIGSRYNIPFLLDVAGQGHNVRGEIYTIDDRMLSRLDVLEDYPRLYERRPEEIRQEADGVVITCWIYLLQRFPERLLEGTELLEEYRNNAHRPYTESDDDNVFAEHGNGAGKDGV
ncbi:putative gamma-glutamylcyclotransferase CG2811 [Anopheles bellator]|uniref:putative gamma-glutamylcyclotransferase CG2811 n=1 Tax=Anopheles bellator TaxID=139047 RepID=UPI00264A376B|nr:putative gamma-glutamylcyclotransferase CG2811 [Anopheles bellator]